MAFSEIKVNKINNVNQPIKLVQSNIYTALLTNDESEASFGGYFQMEERDDKYLIAVKNEDSNSAEVRILASDGIQGVNDLTFTVEASGYAMLNIESGRFKRVSANNGYADNNREIPHGVSELSEKGKVFIIGKDKVNIAVFALPV